MQGLRLSFFSSISACMEALRGERWMFRASKSLLQGVCLSKIDVLWIQENKRTKPDCETVETYVVGSAGTVSLHEEERYCFVRIRINALTAGKQFGVVTDKGETVFSYEASEDGIMPLMYALRGNEDIAFARRVGNVVELALCKDYCDDTMSIEPVYGSNGSTLANVKVVSGAKRCCHDDFNIAIQMPCEVGCYTLAFRERGLEELHLMGDAIRVVEEPGENVLVTVLNKGALQEQYRICGKIGYDGKEYQSTERSTSTLGLSKRTAFSVIDKWKLETRQLRKDVQGDYLKTFTKSGLHINGKPLYFKTFEMKSQHYTEFSAKYSFQQTDNILTGGCSESCRSTSVIRLNKSIDLDIEGILYDGNGNIVGVGVEFEVSEGEYSLCVSNPNKRLLETKVYKSGLLKAESEWQTKKKEFCFTACCCKVIDIYLNEKNCNEEGVEEGGCCSEQRRD